jgi:crotonobetainyl-CoA:carnitine CoA-transferase CaiB-like acyl-CoA transferase
MGFLDGLRVVDCTDERGLVAGRLLADLGADVVQVEPPGGSTARALPPMSDGASLYWDTFAANKRGVVCDLSTPAGRDDLKALVARADFLIESSDPGTFDGLGLGWADLQQVNPKLVYVSISAFGRDGPKAGWAATDLTVWASGGPLAYNQDEVGPPLRISVPQTYLHAAADAAGGALLAHHARRRTGTGQHVDVSAQASLGLATLAATLTSVTGDAEPDWIPKPGGPVTIDQSGSGSRTRRSKWPVLDGYVELHLAMGPAVGAFTNNFFAWMNDEGACPDADIAGWDWRALPQMIRQGQVGGAEIEKARDLVGAFLEGKTKQQVTDAALARKLLSVEVADVSDLATSLHFADREFFVSLGGADRPRRTMPGATARTSPPGFSFRYPAPALGEHDEEVRREWLAGADQDRPVAAEGVPPVLPVPSELLAPASLPSPLPPVPGELPLASLKVADLSWVVAGPAVTRALADFGATVVRVESSVKIETARHMAPFYGGHGGVENSALYINCNAGKLGVALDLSTEEGREVVRDLALWADVLIESYAPGLMDRWKLGYEELSAANPRLIMVSSSLMGNSGRYTRLAGYGNVGAAMGGFQHIVGWPDRPPIGPFGPYTDFVAPRLALVVLLAAIEGRERTGRGCYIDVSQVETGVWFLSPQIAAFVADGAVQARNGNRDAVCVPHGVFPCQRDGPGRADHVAIVARDDADFAALTGVMGRPDLATDAHYATRQARRDNETGLEGLIAAWTATRRASEIEDALQAVGVPVHRASTSTDFVADAQLAHRGHLIRLAHPVHGEVLVEGPRYALSVTPGRVDKLAPTIGQHTHQVLEQILGMAPEEIEMLDKTGVLK